MTRGKILDEAKQIINHDRQDQYGSPEDCFGMIANYWTLWLSDRLADGEVITALDVMEMMGDLKKARRKMNPAHRDSYVDGAGYLALAADEMFHDS